MEKRNIIFFSQGIIIIILTLLTILLILQNLEYKKKYTQLLKQQNTEDIYDNVNNLKTHFLFETFPIDMALDDFYFMDKSEKLLRNDSLIMIFDMSVCGSCLREELRTLSHYKDISRVSNVTLLAITGVTGKNDESSIISLYRSGELFFPFKMVNKNSLYESFKLKTDENLDTPIFFYIDNEFRVLDIFKPRYMQTEGLDRWLAMILK